MSDPRKVTVNQRRRLLALRKRRHEAMLEQGMHAGNTDAKFDPPPEPKTVKLKSKDGCAECEVPEKYVPALISSGKWVRRMESDDVRNF